MSNDRRKVKSVSFEFFTHIDLDISAFYYCDPVYLSQDGSYVGNFEIKFEGTVDHNQKKVQQLINNIFNQLSDYQIVEDSIRYTYYEQNDNHKMNNKIDLWNKIIKKRNKFVELHVHKIGIQRYNYYRNEIIELENEFVSKYI